MCEKQIAYLQEERKEEVKEFGQFLLLLFLSVSACIIYFGYRNYKTTEEFFSGGVIIGGILVGAVIGTLLEVFNLLRKI